MPYLINDETETKRLITDEQMALIREAMNRGEITDCVNDVLDFDECVDLDGDLVLDDDAYDLAVAAMQD